ncbi:MAG: hypothetical protein IJC71_05090 [Clostridia bacterium]|nr:hypothetical protein [Clostridia bacterium]
MQNIHHRIPIAEKGISPELFDAVPGDFVTTRLTTKEIKQVGTVNGVEYKLTIRLTRWTGRTTPAQIVVLSGLFWENYPRMYERFGAAGESPTQITLDIENKGYGIAWNAGNLVHLHDGWLEQYPEDYDCITHELAHAIQNGWNGETLEYEDYIERFADACRFLYAFRNGEYNDRNWEMQTIDGEPTREDSVRFLVWFDYFYSTEDNDLLLNYFRVCHDEIYPTADWKEAWADIFRGSALEGRDIDDIYAEYAASEFAVLPTDTGNGPSPLLSKYDVRRHTK